MRPMPRRSRPRTKCSASSTICVDDELRNARESEPRNARESMRYALSSLLAFAALALAVGGGWCAPASAAQNAAITLRAAADLPGTRYTLGDIADIQSADDGLARRLAAIPIGVVPRQGYTESVSRIEVETLVRQHVPPQAVEWRGASSIRIRGRGQRV